MSKVQCSMFKVNCLTDLDGVSGNLDIMNAKDCSPRLQGQGMESRSSVESFVRRGIQRLIDHRLARNACQHGIVGEETHEVAEMAYQLIVLGHRFAKTEAEVQDDIRHPQVVKFTEPFSQKSSHRGAEIIRSYALATTCIDFSKH